MHGILLIVAWRPYDRCTVRLINFQTRLIRDLQCLQVEQSDWLKFVDMIQC